MTNTSSKATPNLSFQSTMLLSSSHNQTLISDFTSCRSVTFRPRATLFDHARSAVTLIPVPRPVQSLKMIRKPCCKGSRGGENLPSPVDGEITPVKSPGYLEFFEDDLASYESLSKLYERWYVHFNVSRTPAEKAFRFRYFKEYVHDVYKSHQKRQSDVPCRLYKSVDLRISERMGIMPGKNPYIINGRKLIPPIIHGAPNLRIKIYEANVKNSPFQP